jgi:hypothetical protein
MTNFKATVLSLSFFALFASTANIYAMDQNSSDYLAFWCALYDKNFDLAQDILNSGTVTVNTVNNSGETPLLESTQAGDLAVVQFLLSQPNINLETIHPHLQQPALQIAAEAGHSDIVQLLISSGASMASVNFAELFRGFKQNADREPNMHAGMPAGQDEDVAGYGGNGNAHFATYGKRGASGAGEFQSTLTKRSRVAPEQEQQENGGQEWGSEPEFANGGADSVHQFDCLYNFSQNSSFQDNASQEDKEKMVPADGLFAQHRSQSQTPNNDSYCEQFFAQEQSLFTAQPETFMCQNCTYINDPGAEQCAACGMPAFGQ